MKMVWLYLAVLVLIANGSFGASVPHCDNKGCESDKNCPTNSACIATVPNKKCGLCMCKAGYKVAGTKCVQNEGGGEGDNGEIQTTTVPVITTTNGGIAGEESESSTSGLPVVEGNGNVTFSPFSQNATSSASPNKERPSPKPGPLNCADYDCPGMGTGEGGQEDNPLLVRSRLITPSPNAPEACNPIPTQVKCNLAAGGTCYGSCLPSDAGTEYCICAANHIDRQCSVLKHGSCSSATGQLPPGAYQQQNKRFRHNTNPDDGAVIGRNFANSFQDCCKLCQWTQGSCKSVNYGTIGGQKVCELLSVSVTARSSMVSWLQDAQGWEYAQAA